MKSCGLLPHIVSLDFRVSIRFLKRTAADWPLARKMES